MCVAAESYICIEFRFRIRFGFIFRFIRSFSFSSRFSSFDIVERWDKKRDIRKKQVASFNLLRLLILAKSIESMEKSLNLIYMRAANCNNKTHISFDSHISVQLLLTRSASSSRQASAEFLFSSNNKSSRSRRRWRRRRRSKKR